MSRSLPLPPDAAALARIAGLLYLAIILAGLSAEIAVRAAMIVPGDAIATAEAIRSAPGWFRTGIALDIAMLLADVAIAVVFFLLFRGVSLGLALTAAAFRLIQAAVLAANIAHPVGALLILQGAPGLGPEAAAAHALHLLELHAHGYDLGLVFFAVTCAVLGTLVLRSGWFPRALGWLLWAAAAVYLLGSTVRFLAPQFLDAILPLYGIAAIAELAFCLILLLRGPRGPAAA